MFLSRTPFHIPGRTAARQVLSGTAWVLTVALLVSCSQEQQQPAPVARSADTVALIGDRILTVSDLQAEMDWRAQHQLVALSAEELLDRMVLKEAMLQKAKQRNLAQEPEVRRALDRVLVTHLRDQELPAAVENITITEAMLQTAYTNQLDRFTRPALNRLAMLHLKLEKSASEQKKAELLSRIETARTLALEQQKAADFQPAQGFKYLSVEYSDDALSRYRNGDLGWLSPEQAAVRIPAAVFNAARALPIGQISERLQTEDGFYLVMRTDERPERITPYEQVRAQLHAQLKKSARQAAEAAYYANTLASAQPKIFKRALAPLQPPATQPATPPTALMQIAHQPSSF